ILQKYNLVVRASCSLSVSSAHDARTTKNKFAPAGMLPNVLTIIMETKKKLSRRNSTAILQEENLHRNLPPLRFSIHNP
ncbi:MAG: hypothetical protein AAF630_10655, partial [Cyanobacteria bacterium P01_C01_bin.38]